MKTNPVIAAVIAALTSGAEKHLSPAHSATLTAGRLLQRAVLPLLALLCVGSTSFAQDGVFSWAGLATGNQDANVGLTNTKTYLNAVDAGGWGGTVNGVIFDRGNFNSNPSGSNYAVTGAGSTTFRNPINLGGELGKVVSDFVYGGTQTVTLSGLTAGEFYTTTFYNLAWDSASISRAQVITTTGGASTTFDQNFNGQNNANVLRYSFLASDTTEAITFTPVTDGASFHNSAFTTEQVFNKTYVSGGDWTTSTWSTANAPNGVGANADFVAQASPTTMNLDAGQTVGNLRFDGANGWTVAGSNTLTLQADIGGKAIVTATSGTHTIATPTDWNSDVWVTGAGTLELSGQVGTTAKGVTKSDDGTLVLSAANSYSGATDIQQGMVVIANDAALGTGGHDQATMTSIRDGATLALQGDISSGEHAHVWGSGVDGLGAIRNLSGNNALTNMDGSGPGYALRSQTTVGVDTGSLAVSGFYESGGSFGVTKIGAGTLTLTANSTYTGQSFVNTGMLVAEANNALGAGGFSADTKTTVADGATVALQGNISMDEHLHIYGSGVGGQGAIRNLSGSNALTSAYALRSDAVLGADAGQLTIGRIYEEGGTFGVTKVGAGAVVLNGANTYSGPTIVSEGSLATSGNDRLAAGGSVTVNSNATFSLGGNQTLAAVTGAGAVELGANTLSVGASTGTFSGVISGTGGLTKVGAGTTTLTGANTYGGLTTVSDGTLEFTTIAANAPSALGTGSNNSRIALMGGTLRFVGTTTQIVDRNIAWGPGTSAVLEASGAAGAALVINDTAANPWNDPGARTFAFGGSNADDNTYSGVLADESVNVSSVAKSGTGRWVLSGSNSYTGETFVNAGTLVAANNRALGAGGVFDTTKTTVADGATLALQGDISMDEHMHIYGSGVGGQGVIRNVSGINELTSGYALRSSAAVGSDAGQLTFAGSIYEQGGTYGLSKVGDGVVVLAASNNYGGETLVNAGMLVAANNSALGTGGFLIGTKTTVADGATLALQGDISMDEHLHIYGSGVAGQGAIRNLSGSNSLTSSGYALRSDAVLGADAGQLTMGGIYEEGGTYGLTKVGAGAVVLGGSNSYTGTTTISAGTLVVNGAAASSGFVVESGASLSGSGTVGAISGAGEINPGNSPGILTAPSVDASGGLAFNFEFTSLNPTYSNASASLNDVLRLTDATPFVASLTSANTVNIFFDVDVFEEGQFYTGGFFTDTQADFLSQIVDASFNYYVQDAGGSVSYGGQSYSALGEGLAVELTTINQSADFAGGAIDGQVVQFEVVPEPSTYALLVLGAAALGTHAWRKRRRAQGL